MRRSFLTALLPIALLLLFSPFAQAQFYKSLKGDPLARKINVHSGNQIRTTFFNYGLVGRINAAEHFGGEWPINSGHFYVGDISVMVGAEIRMPDGRIITPVTVADGPRGSNEVDPTNSSVFWGWEPLPDFNNPGENLVAMSHQRNSWPPTWPDRETDANDPGWPGQWNGFFGKDQFNADQESYWLMDDSRDKEFIRNPGFFPDSTDLERGGLGLLARVRGLQWSQVLAQNTIFWLYDITNVSTTDYNKANFGMIVGTTIGGDGDTNDDNSQFDARNNLTFSWDNDNIGNTGWTPVGYMGYAFLESPGNRLDGIDDDNDEPSGGADVVTTSLLLPRIASVGDSVVTINYADPDFPRQVISFPSEGVTIPSNGTTRHINPGDSLIEIPFNNVDDNLNGLIDENTEIPADGLDNNGNGLIDEVNPQLGLKYRNFLGNNTNYPLIDEGRDDGIDNDGDWNASTDDVGLDGKPNTGDFGEGDGQPTSGFQPGPDGRLVDSGLPGEPNIDKTDIDESDQIGLTSFFFFQPFNFIRLRDDADLWDALRPGFFASNVPQNVDGDFIYGTAYFPLRVGQTERISLAFFFGDNRDEIFRTKNTVQQIYNNSYQFAKAPILPTVRAFGGDNQATIYWDFKSEESFDKLSQAATGNPFDFEGYKIYRATFPTFDETGVVTNVFGSRVADVPIAQFDIIDADSGFFPVVDPLTGSTFYLGNNTGLVHTYVDTSVQNGFTYFYAVTGYDRGININDLILPPAETAKFASVRQDGTYELGQNVVAVRPEAPAAGFEAAAVENLVQTAGDGNGRVFATIADPIALAEKDGHEYELTFRDDGTLAASTTSFSVVDLTAGEAIVSEQSRIDIDATVFDGIKLSIINGGLKNGPLWQTTPVPSKVRWADSTRNILSIAQGGWDLFVTIFARSERHPANYQLEVGEVGVDTSAGISTRPLLPRVPTNFRIKNLSEDKYIKFEIFDRSPSGESEPPGSVGIIDENDIIFLYEPDGNQQVFTWRIVMEVDSTAELPRPGDVLSLPVDKPFLHSDKFRFKVKAAQENLQVASEQLKDIKVVPNPYIATASWEPRNNFSNGRGPRAIHFTHLPRRCTIRIYTVRGELVDVIEHDSSVTNGTADWDLLTVDQLDVAYGVYIFHVDAPGIGETIGKFAVIK